MSKTIDKLEQIKKELCYDSLYIDGVSIGGERKKVIFLDDALRIIDKVIKEYDE